MTKETPPTFLVQAEDDPVHVENATAYFLALKNAGVPTELHVYAEGGHGYGLRRTELPVTEWPDLVDEWMKTIGVTSRPAACCERWEFRDRVNILDVWLRTAVGVPISLERWNVDEEDFVLWCCWLLGSGAFVAASAQAVPSLDDDQESGGVDAGDDDAGYRSCLMRTTRAIIEKLGTLVVDDLEFYHDKTGLAVGKQPFLDAIKNNICGKVTRELVAGSLEVYPMHGMARWRLGCTGFIIRGRRTMMWWGRQSSCTLWQYKDGAWKITRVISYDHEAGEVDGWV